MTGYSDKTFFWRQLILLIGLLVIAFLFNEFINFKQGYLVYLGYIVEGGLVFLLAKVSYVIILQRVSFHYHKAYHKTPPHFMVRVLQFIIIFFTLLAIVVFVLNKAAFSIMALGGVVGAGAALGVGPIILDAFSGLVHESESGFEIGDWIQVDERRLGKVKSISWRTVTLETGDRTTIVIPQRKLSDGYVNLSRPTEPSMQTVEITLDHTIPIDRAERLLTGIVTLVKGVHKKDCSAWALKATEGGIVYAVRYLIGDYGHWREIKHRVLEAITQQLHECRLKLSETIGEYALSKGGKPFEEYSPLLPEQIFSKVDLFAILPNAAFTLLCHSAKKQVYNYGSYIVQQGDEGDSLFVVAEGVVEVLLKEKTKIASVAHLTTGAYFGEMSLLTGNRRSATIKATTNCAVYEVSKTEMEPILKKDQSIIELLSQKINERESINVKKMKSKKHKSKQNVSEVTKVATAIRGYFGL
ncbi:MAG: mechanosensitive ion channel family protein [Candidatus Saccharimonadaceae bacterium]